MPSDWLRAFWSKTKELDFSQTYGSHRIIKDITVHHFQGKKRYINRLEFWQKPITPYFGLIFGLFPQNEIFLEKFTFVKFLPLRVPNFIQNLEKSC